MLLWTIQHKAAYDILLETGRLIANENIYRLMVDYVVIMNGLPNR
nr:hypothetical protein [uncultured Lachnoanaerobaculum sp.]